MKDEKGNDLKDLEENLITTKVFVTTNPSLKEELLSQHKQECDLGEKKGRIQGRCGRSIDVHGRSNRRVHLEND